MTDLVEIVLDAFAEMTGEVADEDQLASGDSSMWDSLTHVYIVHSIERRLGVELPEKVLSSRANLGELLAVVRTAVGEG
jgi:acyl carrier protein